MPNEQTNERDVTDPDPEGSAALQKMAIELENQRTVAQAQEVFEELQKQAAELGVNSTEADLMKSLENSIVNAPKSEIGTERYRKLIDIYKKAQETIDLGEAAEKKEFEERRQSGRLGTPR